MLTFVLIIIKIENRKRCCKGQLYYQEKLYFTYTRPVCSLPIFELSGKIWIQSSGLSSHKLSIEHTGYFESITVYLYFIKPFMTATQINKTGHLMRLLSQRVPNLYLTKLLKLLYLIDETATRQLGTPVTWLTYKVWQFGPVPTTVYNDISFDHTKLFGQYITGREEELKTEAYHGKGIRIEPLGMPNLGLFSQKELEIIDQTVEQFGSYSTKELVEHLHREHSLWDTIYKEHNLEERFKYAEYNTSPYEIDFTVLLGGDEEKLSIYRSMEEFWAFEEAFSE